MFPVPGPYRGKPEEDPPAVPPPQSVSLIFNKNRTNRIMRSVAPRDIQTGRTSGLLSANRDLSLSWKELL